MVQGTRKRRKGKHGSDSMKAEALGPLETMRKSRKEARKEKRERSAASGPIPTAVHEVRT